jgi:predicted ATPase
VVFLTGEPGIGKTRLLASCARPSRRRAGARPARWLEGRCVSYGESMPYWPLRDLLRSWLGVLADEPELRVRVALRRKVDELFGEGAADIYPYLGALLGLTLEPDVEARLAELSPGGAAVPHVRGGAHVARASRRRRTRRGRDRGPALGRLHLAPTPATAGRGHRHGGLLLVITARPERDHAAWRLKEDVGRELPHRTRELALDALSRRRRAASSCTRWSAPARCRPTPSNGSCEPAEGNPFFLEEIVRSLADAGALVHDDEGGWRFDHEIRWRSRRQSRR